MATMENNGHMFEADPSTFALASSIFAVDPLPWRVR
jgi:hypothetical protein